MAIARFFLGLEEQEFYENFPLVWWGVVTIGFTFVGSLFYGVKKMYDVNPNIHLRAKPDDFLEAVLEDPEYDLWHQEAQRLLTYRRATGKPAKSDIPRWISWPLLAIMYLLLAILLIAITGAVIITLID